MARKNPGKGFCREEKAFRKPGRYCFEARRGWSASDGVDPRGWDQRAEVLQIEKNSMRDWKLISRET